MAAKALIQIVGGLVVLAAALLGNTWRASEPPPAPMLGLKGIELGEHSFQDEPLDPQFLDVLRAREVTFRAYDDQTRPIWLFAGYFDRQREGSQVHSPRHCYPGSGWAIVSEAVVPAPWDSTIDVMSLVVSDGSSQRLVYYWYQTPTRVLHSVLSLKLELTRRAALGKRQEVVFARVSTTIDENKQEAVRLQSIATQLNGEIDRLYQARTTS